MFIVLQVCVISYFERQTIVVQIRNLVPVRELNTHALTLHRFISGALKLYLRELPEPLMTFSLYNEWMQAAHM